MNKLQTTSQVEGLARCTLRTDATPKQWDFWGFSFLLDSFSCPLDRGKGPCYVSILGRLDDVECPCNQKIWQAAHDYNVAKAHWSVIWIISHDAVMLRKALHEKATKGFIMYFDYLTKFEQMIKE